MRKLCGILKTLGFEKLRQKGSHVFYIHEDGRRTVIPIHSEEGVGVVLLKEILKEVELARKEYQTLF